jgi:hypothetical protein
MGMKISERTLFLEDATMDIELPGTGLTIRELVAESFEGWEGLSESDQVLLLEGSMASFMEKMVWMKEQLKTAGVVDVDAFMAKAEAGGKMAASLIKDTVDSPEGRKRAVNHLAEAIKSTFYGINVDQMKKALIMLLFVLLLNTFMYTALVMVFGTAVGGIITAVVVAPLTEEISKHIAIKGGYHGAFVLSINIFEFFSYVSLGVRTGGKLGKVIIIRTASAMTHWLEVVLQKYFDQKKASTTGLVVAILIHATWNALAGSSVGRSVGKWVTE